MGRAPRAPQAAPPPPPVAAPQPPRVLNRAYDGLPVAPLPARPAPYAPRRAFDEDDDEDEDMVRNLRRMMALIEVNRIEGRRQALDGGSLDWMERGGPKPRKSEALLETRPGLPN